jgi:hypothetical protein
MISAQLIRKARLFFIWLFISSLVFFVVPPDNQNRISLPPRDDSIITLVAVCTAVISAIGTISTIILAWRSDRRDEREKELRIKQLERELESAKQPELEAAKQTPTTPTPYKKRKKVR